MQKDDEQTPTAISAGPPCSLFVWTLIEGYAPMEDCHVDGINVGWIRPRDLTGFSQRQWGSAADWPGEWQAIPHREDAFGQPLDWELATYCPSHDDARKFIEAL